MAHVFLCYAAADYEKAQRFHDDLAAFGYRIWFEDISRSLWKTPVVKAIAASQATLVLLSARSSGPNGCGDEQIRNALTVLYPEAEARPLVIPVRLEDCAISFPQLVGIQHVDMFPAWDEGLRRIDKALARLEVDDAVPRGPRRREPKWTMEVRDLFLCHRGAEPSVVAEIVATLRAKNQFVTVQDGDGLSEPLAALRARVRREIDGGCRHVIVLLNEHLTGPVYRQTFAPIRKAVGTDVAFWLMRVEVCDLDGVDFVSVDLANLDDPAARRREILTICPTESDLVR
jgi:TIR domain-containing protein